MYTYSRVPLLSLQRRSRKRKTRGRGKDGNGLPSPTSKQGNPFEPTWILDSPRIISRRVSQTAFARNSVRIIRLSRAVLADVVCPIFPRYYLMSRAAGRYHSNSIFPRNATHFFVTATRILEMRGKKGKRVSLQDSVIIYRPSAPGNVVDDKKIWFVSCFSQGGLQTISGVEVGERRREAEMQSLLFTRQHRNTSGDWHCSRT